MDVVRHENEFVKLKYPALAVGEHSLEKQVGGTFGLKYGAASPGYGGDEECALGGVVHSG